MDALGIQRALVRIAHEILEHNKGTEHLALVGIRSRGVYLAQRIRKAIDEIETGGALSLPRAPPTPPPAPPHPGPPTPPGPRPAPPPSPAGKRGLPVPPRLLTP